MNFKINRKRLYDACRKVSRTAFTKSKSGNIHVLSCIMMNANADKKTLTLTCNNITVSMMIKLKDVDVLKSGTSLVQSSLFTSMLGAMEDETAAVSVNNNVLMLQCGNPIFHTTVYAADDFPNVNISYPENTICVNGLSLLTKRAASVASESENNPSYQGVQLKFSQKEATATATDGFRFLKSYGSDYSDGDMEMLIPEQSLNIICNMIKANDEIYIGINNNTAVFMGEEPGAAFVFTTSLLNGDLKNVENIVNKVSAKYSVIVDAKEFADAVSSCIVMTTKVDPCVDITITDESLKLLINNENGEIDIDVEAHDLTNMEGIVFHYKPTYIYNFLRTCNGPVKVEIADNGILKLNANLTTYIVSPRSPAKIKERKTDNPTSKIKKEKTVKTVA